METQDNEIDNLNTTSAWSSAANWTISGGSLVNCVNFESSLSPIDDEALNSAPGSSLILQRPSSDSGPCEMTINFTQKHEVQQVYVRSTARVYEIYYASDLRSGNEYLCTVRCGVAARDGEVLHTGDNEKGCSANSNGSLKDPAEESSRNGNSPNNSEDDWVEVKVSDPHMINNKINSLPLKLDPAQVFYEATAQISDASPCGSLTLRLLSLERKDCVCIDEVYVFADPVDPDDLDNQVSKMENSAGNSLMAMLVPTLLQFSKTRCANLTEDMSSDTWGKQNNSLEIRSKTIDSSSAPVNVQEELPDHQEIKVEDVNRDTLGTAQVPVPPQISVRENKLDCPPYSHVERAVDQLCSRMSRIEDLFLRFEEKMLKPISSIETRLERVEQQLEVLTNKSQNSGLPSGSRFYAPAFSCNDSDSNSFYNSGNDYSRCEVFESGKKDIESDALLTTDYDMSGSVNSTHGFPSLVVTAPEFLTCDDEEEEEEEEDHESDVMLNSSEDKPRPALTIDDALASALAGFMSSSTPPQNYTQTLSFKAPEFVSDEDEIIDSKSSVIVEVGTDLSICSGEMYVTESIKDSVTDSAISFSENEGNVKRSPNDEDADKILGVDGLNIENAVDLANHGISAADFLKIEEIENGEGEVIIEMSNMLDSDETDISNQLPHHGHDNSQEDANTDTAGSTTRKEETQENSDNDILKNIFEFSRTASMVDFEVPVLDVKFASQDGCDNANLALEDLLGEFSESTLEAHSVKESDDVPPAGADCNLIAMEDEEQPVGPASNVNFPVDMDFYSVVEPLSMWDAHACNSHETFAASLI